MFNQFTSFVRQAAEVLAPSLPPKEDFRAQWKNVTTTLIDMRDDRQPIQTTKIPKFMTKMLKLLTTEDKQFGDNTGPCLEYLLQHKVLETLYTLGRGDTPPGMKTQVLRFFTTLLSDIRHPLLPQVHVHKPVQRLIRCCGNIAAGPTESEEVDFLLSLCQKFRKDSSLANFFLETYATMSPGPDQKSKAAFRFHLLSALLELSKSADTSVAMKAYEGLIVCVSLPEEATAVAIATNSQYCQLVVKHLESRFLVLPPTLDGIDITSVTAKWRWDYITESLESTKVRRIEYFLQWLDYINQVSKLAHPIISKRLAKIIQEEFLQKSVMPRIQEPNEEAALTCIAYVTHMLESIDAVSLVEAFVDFFIGIDGGASEENHPPDVIKHPVRHKLIQQCDHMSDELSIAYMQFFAALLSLPSQHVIESLVVKNLASRSYNKAADPRDFAYLTDKYGITATSDGSIPGLSEPATGLLVDVNDMSQTERSSSSTPLTSPDEDLGFQSLAQLTQGKTSDVALLDESQTSSVTTVSPGGGRLRMGEGELEFKSLIQRIGGGSLIRKLAQMRIVCDENSVERLMTKFLCVLPRSIASVSTDLGSMALEAYLADASFEVCTCFSMCCPWSHSGNQATQANQSTFLEGFFLTTLLNGLQRLLDQPYEVNLILTRLLIKIARFPHPVIHEYFFDADVALSVNARTLFSILCQLREKVLQKIEKTPNFTDFLAEARRRLICQESADIQSNSISSLADNVVLLEEFTKELAATLYTKSNVSLQET
eukprot:m.181977 g.181977  ORF g.181977 m.181977 type:complete len:769 (+) comp39280_c0_seq4:20-2326(+)